MGDVLNMLAFRKRQGQQLEVNADGKRDTILIERLPTGEISYTLTGGFAQSRRLSAQAMTKVLDRVLED